VSVTGSKTLWRIDGLLGIDLAMRFVSFEPLLGPVDVRPYLRQSLGRREVQLGIFERTYVRPGLDWCIVGGENGPSARPMQPE
jgi:protein gp37